MDICGFGNDSFYEVEPDTALEESPFCWPLL